MLKKIKQNILTILFITVILVGLFGTMITQGKYIAWNVLKNNGDYRKSDSIGGILSSYPSAFEGALNESVFLKEKYIDLFGLLQRAMTKDVIPSDGYTGTIVKGSDNKLYSASSIVTEDNGDYYLESISEYSDHLVNLKSVCSECGTNLLYVQTPQKYHEGVTVPVPIDAQRLIARRKTFLEQIDGQVDFIDMTQKLYDEGIDYDTVFFATDHHWTVDSAFWCYQEICEYLNNYTDYQIDKKYYDKDNWNVEVLKNAYLGSTGVRVGGYYVGKDDFSLYTPKFATDFKRNYLASEVQGYKGNFAHSVLAGYDKLVNGDYSELSWGVYTGADTSYVKIDNNLIDNDKKVLVIKDSFALPVCAFLSTTCKELVMYDMRSPHECTLEEYIKQEDFDLVIVIYCHESLKSLFFDFAN